MNKILLFCQKNIITILLSIGIVGYALLFYFSIGPFNLYIDSGGYLTTADTLFQGKGFIFNPNRPIGLPLLYWFILFVSQYHLFFIVFFQVVFFIASLIFVINTVTPRLNRVQKLLLTFVILFFSSRTFIYSYGILSEAIFSSLLLIFIAFCFKYIRFIYQKNKKDNKEIVSFNWIFIGLFLSSICLALTKSIGILFMGFFAIIIIFELFVNRSKLIDLKVYVIISLILIGVFIANYKTLGTIAFSKQDGIQLLISANEYINYNSSFMSHEKNLIHENHQTILRQYTPKTRLDEIIGPLPNIKTPSQLIMEDSNYNYDIYNNKIKGLIMEGLSSNGNWFKYIKSGFGELNKMIVFDDKNGQIVPLQIENSNQLVLSWLPSIQSKNIANFSQPHIFAQDTYRSIIKYGLLPKYVAPSILFILLLMSILIIGWGFSLPIIVLTILIFTYLYLSVLLVFSLDRYFVGIEVVIYIFIVYILHELLINRKKYVKKR